LSKSAIECHIHTCLYSSVQTDIHDRYREEKSHIDRGVS